nr:uncharacterized protein LOC108080101 [Drosophila kikkawai]
MCLIAPCSSTPLDLQSGLGNRFVWASYFVFGSLRLSVFGIWVSGGDYGMEEYLGDRVTKPCCLAALLLLIFLLLLLLLVVLLLFWTWGFFCCRLAAVRLMSRLRWKRQLLFIGRAPRVVCATPTVSCK